METQQTTEGAQITESPRTRVTRRRLRPVAAVVLAVGLATSGVALAHGSQSSAATPDAARSVSAAAVSNEWQASSAPSSSANGRFSGPMNGGVRAGRFGRGLTVSRISGSTITATVRGSQTITITVTSSTKYTRAGATIALGDLRQGDQIAVQGTRSAQGTVTATAVDVILPRESGVVTGVSGSNVTITSFDGSMHTVVLSPSTTYKRAGHSGSQSDVTANTSIDVVGTANADGSLNALLVNIQTPRVSGQVSTVAGGSYTIANRAGTSSKTVVTTSSTLFVDMSGATVNASTIVKGSEIVAEGTLSADGKTLTALRITVFGTAQSGRPGPGFGFFGRNGGRFGSGSGQHGASPNATPAATAGTGV